MNRLDRALGVLLLLRSGKTVSAAELAAHFEVSLRTIYRDMETLCAIGVPIYAEMGRSGGFRLVEGYFLPPVMFSVGEATSLLLGLTLLRRLRARPFAGELDAAEQKLLAAVPQKLRAVLERAQQIIGFESIPYDVFHPEWNEGQAPSAAANAGIAEEEGAVISQFLQAVLDRKTIALRYYSPYKGSTENLIAVPYGLFWDRDRWYLVGKRTDSADKIRLWRADRVLTIAPNASHELPTAFDVNTLLGRDWLHEAMTQWRQEAPPVVIRLTRQQAARLQQDWYYQHAHYEDLSASHMVMTFGENDRTIVLELLRWLGPGAELLEPKAWRAVLRQELIAMLSTYSAPGIV